MRFLIIGCVTLVMSLTAPTLTAAPSHAITTLSDGSIKVTPSDGAEFDRFGFEVDISGTTAVIGAYADNAAGASSGAAYIYTATGNGIVELANLVGSDTESGDQFGWSVAIDGDTLVVGAPRAGVTQFDRFGAAYVFTRQGNGTWVQQQILTAGNDEAPNTFFGYDVAIDGNVIVVASQATANDATNGAVYAFTRSGTTWTRQQRLTIADTSDAEAGDNFAWAVAVDNITIHAGAARHNNSAGAVYSFERNVAVWEQRQKITPNNAGASAQFGYAVAIDDDRAIIGARADDENGTAAGSAYIYRDNGVVWIEEDKLLASNPEPQDFFGVSVAIDGDLAAVGTLLNGKAYAFGRNGTTWSQTNNFTPADTNDFISFGSAVALAGNVVVVGAQGADDNIGAAYVYIVQTVSIADLDVNSDNVITAADAIYVINRVGSNDLSADVNGDNMVDQSDVQLVLGSIGQTVN